MDKINTSLNVVFIVNFSDLNRSVVYCHRIWLQHPDDRDHPAEVRGGAAVEISNDFC